MLFFQLCVPPLFHPGLLLRKATGTLDTDDYFLGLPKAGFAKDENN